MDLSAAVVTLLLIIDPLGNVPLWLSVLRHVAPARRRVVLVRELGFAYLVLLGVLFAGQYLMRFLQLQQETISISGGIVLFLIALRMIFPGDKSLIGEPVEGEPFVVPLAVPLFAGPSTLAGLLLLERAAPDHLGSLFMATTMAWAISGAILLSSDVLYKVLRERGLVAMERLMGMLLVMVAVQMLMNGLDVALRR